MADLTGYSPFRRRAAACAAAAVALLGVSGGPADAQVRSFAPPAGCTGYLTVQTKDCRVSNHYTCEDEPEGHRWRVDFNPVGPYHVVLIDAETQWLEMHDRDAMSSWVIRRLQDGAPDPASMSALLDDGLDTYLFTIVSDADGEAETYSGFDRMSGEEVTIDGVRLLETEFSAVVSDPEGTELRRVSGREYVHPGYRHFIGGSVTVERADGSEDSFDGSPVTFAFPGERGFFTTTPAYGCMAEQSDAAWRGPAGGFHE